MEKISILLATLSFICFTCATVKVEERKKAPDCATYPTLMDVDKCCFQKGKNKYDYAYENCLRKFAKCPHGEYCASECAAYETGFANPDYTVNYDGLRRLVKDQLHDPVLEDFVMNTVRDCEQQVRKMVQNPPYSTAEKTQCGPGFYLLQRCYANHGVQYCPVQKYWIENDTCMQTLNDTKSCPFGN